MKDKTIPIIVMGANGRMGRTITGLVKEDPELLLAGAVENAGHTGGLAALGCPVSENLADLAEKGEKGIIIDFTAPAASIKAAETAAASQWGIVMGTTGFDAAQKRRLAELAFATPILWSANMSVGVNTLLRVLPELAKALGTAYDMEMVEIHHKHKKDAPSGTALMLADVLAQARGQDLDKARKSCRDGITGERAPGEIGVMALRGGDVVGVHTCYFFGPGEALEITHRAESRENFARGAIRAAKWLSGREKGKLYSMSDVIWGTDK